MASLAISAAVNIGIGLLLNFLFPKKGPKVEGPRLSDLSVSSSSYGQPVRKHFGTVRAGGAVIWSPGIEEVKKTKKQKGPGKGVAGIGGGGGGSVTTYTYFASFALLFGEGEAEDVLRIWADGKLIFDKTANGNSVNTGGDTYKFRFYKGDEDQLPDALIEADKGVGNVPAHRGYCYLVAERWPLANFGNRIPNITAEITFKSEVSVPFTGLTELPSQNIPGSPTGADSTSWMVLDPFSDGLYFFKGGSNGVARVSLGSMATQSMASFGGLNDKSFCFGSDGFIWSQNGSSNFVPFVQYDPISLEPTGLSLGSSGSLGTWGNDFSYPNGCYFGVLRVGDPALGVDFVDVYAISANAILGDGGFVLVYKNELGVYVQEEHITGVDIGRGGPVLQDRIGQRILVLQESNTETQIWQVKAKINVGTMGPYVSPPEVELVYTITKGGTDLAGTGDVTGWCFLPSEYAVILSNGTSMCKLDLEAGVVLERNLSLGFYSKEQYSNNGMFAFGDGNSSDLAPGHIYTISTDDLTVIDDQTLTGIFADGNTENYPRSAYDPRNHSIIFSREHGETPSAPRVVRMLLGRRNALGVPLSDVVSQICQDAGLLPALFDVTDLASESVFGYSLTQQASARSGLEPLMQAFLFEGAESDWKIKFVRRGGSPVLTVAEDDLGRLNTSDDGNPIKETLRQEVELPARFTVRYVDKDKDYQTGAQSDKRVSSPVPSQYADNETTLDVEVVGQAEYMKRLAQRWLYLSWTERVAIASALPWRYIKLDPTDVFNLTYRGETRRLRMGEMEIGADLSIDFVATQEDAASNGSTVSADGGLGLVPQVIPSGFPTKLLLLDLPLLLAADSGLQEFCRAYFAAAGYDGTWPGMSLYQSSDNGSSFAEVGSTSEEATWGRIDGTIADPATVTTWDEAGTITLQVQRGIANLTSASEAEVLDGANAIAVIRGDGLPEIIQFQNATQLDAGRVQISRLLRGRRGTEPNATGHSSAETWVLLSEASIETFQLAIDLIGDLLQYRAPTLGTFIEDAQAVFHRYTGQDLLPYSPANIAGSRDGSGNLTVTWERRTRYNGELLDGTGEVPLNEGSEAYEVEFYYLGNLVATKQVTAKTATLTAAEFVTAGYLSGDVGLLNRSFELATSWNLGAGAAYVTLVTGGGNPDLTAQDGTRFLFMGDDPVASSEAWQEIDLLANDWDANWIDDNRPTVSLAYYHEEQRASQTEHTEAILQFRDASGGLLASHTSGLVNPSPDGTWVDATPVAGVMPIGTRKVRVRLIGYRAGIGLDSPEVCFDNIRLTAGVGVPQGITVRVYQMSEIVGRGRRGEAIV